MIDKPLNYYPRPLPRRARSLSEAARGRTEARSFAPAGCGSSCVDAREVMAPTVVPDANLPLAKHLLIMEVFEKASVGGPEGVEWAKLGRFLVRQYQRRGASASMT